MWLQVIVWMCEPPGMTGGFYFSPASRLESVKSSYTVWKEVIAWTQTVVIYVSTSSTGGWQFA